MGSWNSTCGVTHLPIREGDEIALFLICATADRKGQIGGHHTYPPAMWSPIALPLYGQADDGGQIVHPQPQWNVDYSVEIVRNHLVEYEQGSNPYWDLAVVRDEMVNFDYLSERIVASRLFLDSPFIEEPLPVAWMMVHRFIYDAMAAMPPSEWIVARDGDYRQQFQQYFRDELNAPKDRLDRALWTIRHRADYAIIERLSSVSNCYHSYGPPVGVRDVLERFTRYAHDGRSLDDPLVADLVDELVKFVNFASAMSDLRRIWSPQSGGGRFDEDYERHEQINQLVANHLNKQMSDEWDD